MQLKLAVIHLLEKDANSTEAETTIRDSLLDVNKTPIQSLVQGVVNLFGKADNALLYGQFMDNKREGEFPSHFAGYVSSTRKQQDFLKLSAVAMEELRTQSEKETLATGGYILFAEYEEQGIDFLLVTMIKHRAGIQLDKNFEPISIEQLDMSKIHQAARINCEKFAQWKRKFETNNTLAEDEDNTYLSFVNRKAANETAGYFIEALGCSKGISSARATMNALHATSRYLKNNKLDEYSGRAKRALTEYMYAREEGLPMTLDELYGVVMKQIPVEKHQHLQGYKEYLNGEEGKVPSKFEVSRATLKPKIRISGGSDELGWHVNFEKGKLGSNENSKVFFNSEKTTLTFSGLPGDMVEAIKKELALKG